MGQTNSVDYINYKREYDYNEKGYNITKYKSKNPNSLGDKIAKVRINETKTIFYSKKDWEEIIKKGHKDIEFCIADNNINGLRECMSIMNKDSFYAQFRTTTGPVPCLTWFYRPGAIIDERDYDIFKANYPNVLTGKKCRLVYQDFNYDDNDLERCCFSENKTKCNKNLINNYKTDHCNIIMLEKCKNNPEHPSCILWLEQTHERKEETALKFYSDLCSENFDKQYCDYFCSVSRKKNDYKGKFCDISLEKWCKKHPDNNNCKCLITPKEIIPDVEQYVGPKECWLKECSSQSNNKWLTTEQIETRANCQITSCLININELTLNDNAKAEFINNCVSGTSVNSSSIIKKSKQNEIIIPIKTPGIFFFPELALLFGGLFLLGIQK